MALLRLWQDDEHDLLAPLSGKITSVNRLLERAVMLIHESPYDKGWLFTIQWSQESELEQLWEEETYVREFSLEDPTRREKFFPWISNEPLRAAVPDFTRSEQPLLYSITSVSRL